MRNSSSYLCIVIVLMLREGWDVRNVTTIVPLRPYSSKLVEAGGVEPPSVKESLPPLRA